MKFLFSTRRFLPPFMGGVDVYADRLGRALMAEGHQVNYLAFNDGESSAVQVVQDRYGESSVWRLKFSVPSRPEESFALAYDAEVGRIVSDILDAERPDLFVILNFYLLTFAAVEAAHAQGIPVIHIATDFVPVCRRATLIRGDGQTCRSGESLKACAACYVSGRQAGRLAAKGLSVLPEGVLTWAARQNGKLGLLRPLAPYWRQVRLMEQRLATLPPLRRQVDLVLAPTRYTAGAFTANGFAAEQVRLLPFGVEPDHPLATVEHTEADHVRFLFVGRLQPYKGVHLLIEAFNNLAAPQGATLTIYGAADGHDDYFVRLQQMAAGNERICFAGTIPPSELARAFAAADYFLLPSTWHENSPLILLDALQSRTPIIASDIGGVRDVVQHERNGLLFPPGDSAALQALLQRTIDRPELRDELRAGVNLPTIQQYARQLLEYCAP